MKTFYCEKCKKGNLVYTEVMLAERDVNAQPDIPVQRRKINGCIKCQDCGTVVSAGLQGRIENDLFVHAIGMKGQLLHDNAAKIYHAMKGLLELVEFYCDCSDQFVSERYDKAINLIQQIEIVKEAAHA